MSLKSIWNKLFPKSEEKKCECKCGCKDHSEETIEHIVEMVEPITEPKVEISKIDTKKAVEIVESRLVEIAEKKKSEASTIEKIAESVKNTEPLLKVTITKEVKKVTAKEIKEKVKKPAKKVEEKIEIKPKTPRKRAPKKDKPTE